MIDKPYAILDYRMLITAKQQQQNKNKRYDLINPNRNINFLFNLIPSIYIIYNINIILS